MNTYLTKAPISGEYYVFRDPVHNLIEIDDEQEGRLLRSILETKECQRLRFLRQNGVAAFVYPGIEGSRFQHSLGTYSVARKLIRLLQNIQPKENDGFSEHLRIKSSDLIAFPIAALLHDIGHGPLSHIWEECFSTFKHEQIGLEILKGNNGVSEILRKKNGLSGNILLDDVTAFLDGSHSLYYLLPLLSGDLDVDRLDYIARDTRAAGVTYGFHDLEWIIRSLRFAKLPRAKTHDDGRQWVIAIDGRKGLNTLDQFLKSRENMYELVYYHKTIRCMTVMLKSLFNRVIELSQHNVYQAFATPSIKQWFENPNKQFSGEDVLGIDDTDVWCSIKLWSKYSEDKIVKTLSESILSRKLFKYIPLSNKQKMYFETALNSHYCDSIYAALNYEADEVKYLHQLDIVNFDIIGKEYMHPTDGDRLDPFRNFWIIEDGKFGHQFTSLRDWWKEKHRVSSFKIQKCGLVVEKSGLKAIAPILEKLNNLPNFDENLAKEIIGGYKVIAKISSSGAHKEVFAAISENIHSNSDILVAVKRYKNGKSYAVGRDVTTPNVLIETSGLDKDNLSLARSLRTDSGDTIIVEKFWDSSLEEHVNEHGVFRDVYQILDFGHQLFKGLAALHAAGIRHTDIKPDNCGFMKSFDYNGGEVFRYLIGDFGCCSSQPSALPENESLLGTERTRAPELYEAERKIDFGSDVWALAVTIFAIVCGRYWFLPFDLPHAGDGCDDSVENKKKRFRNQMLTDIPAAVLGFRNAVKQEMPPIIADILLPALEDLGDRNPAGHIADQFSIRKNEIDSERRKDIAQYVWPMSQDISRHVQSTNICGKESKKYKLWVSKNSDLIPPIVVEKISERLK